MRKIVINICLFLIPFSAAAETTSGILFSHEDWEIACDNTLTCRAAGYQKDDAELTLSLLLTRKAGPFSEVTAELILGEMIEDSPSSVELKINNRSYGIIKLNGKTKLSSSQRDALLNVLPKSSRIEFVKDKKIWHLSDRGATAVLLKMDEFQGRIDTPGALVRKGNKNENTVPAEIPLPVIVKGKTIDTPLSFSTDIPTYVSEMREQNHD